MNGFHDVPHANLEALSTAVESIRRTQKALECSTVLEGVRRAQEALNNSQLSENIRRMQKALDYSPALEGIRRTQEALGNSSLALHRVIRQMAKALDFRVANLERSGLPRWTYWGPPGCSRN